ncbi:alkaline phosphatase D family protein [Agaribacterium haliotis]|uniref:alkaline phosphatase D family protein n=1 Tax=Agaribacterium haliotis TaxID=2013869 RepID=UPI000BB5966C|nr:alkaline phosphatase D family protein [Agaribacterium haliotis]
MNRRRLLKHSGIALLTPFVLNVKSVNAAIFSSSEQNGSENWQDVFSWSVASGDPSSSGAIIWTRINELEYREQASLSFDVASDKHFNNIEYSGLVSAEALGSQRDYTVNIDLDGLLSSSKTYYYRFHYRGETSRTGRFKTLAKEGVRLEELNIAVLTCQDYSTGYFNAFDRLAEEELDFVVHLGDFIYEYAEYPNYAQHVRKIKLPSGQKKADNLEDYRHIYRLYREDPSLQRAMEQHAFVIVWDDHETANDCYWDYDNDTLGLPEDDSRHSQSADKLRQLRRDAQRAWIEYIPARVQVDESAEHPFDYLKMYRRLAAGDLLDLFMTDSRSYRTQQACAEGGNALGCKGNKYWSDQQSMLGLEQKEWMLDGMISSNANWKVWGNQTMLGQIALTFLGAQLSYANFDAWDGYQYEREDILRRLKDAGIDNRLVVLTGDMHTYLTSYIKLDYGNINNWDYSNLSGVEIMTPSLTSPNIDDLLRNAIKVPLSSQQLANGGVQTNNPHIKDFSSGLHGYTRMQFKRDEIFWWVYDVKTTYASSAKKLSRAFKYEADGTWIRRLK